MKKKKGKVLIIDDDEDILQAARLFLKQHAAEIHASKNPKSIPNFLKNNTYDVIFLDMNFAKGATSGKEGFYWLDKILEIDPLAVIVMITAFGDVEMAVMAIKEGASDFILKPWHNERFLATFSTAMNLHQSRIEAKNLRLRQKQLSADLDLPYHDFLGQSQVMQTVFTSIQKVAKTDANILILGENGTGKELAARSLHRQSTRANEVFISVDMGALSESLFESELFGHVKGAFTDARTDRSGRFEVASGGTLFLDEIGNIPFTLQAKLLGVIATRTVTRIGSNRPVSVNVHLICATNMPIYNMVAQNKFRQDLLYRINTVEINLPPLRERHEDIPLLTDHFLKIYCKKYNKPIKKINAETLKKFESYHWPGNVRELQHTLERAVIMSDYPVLQPSDFLFPAQDKEALIFEDYNLEQVEKATILKVISKHEGNISHAAKELGLSRTSLYRRLQKYGL